MGGEGKAPFCLREASSDKQVYNQGAMQYDQGTCSRMWHKFCTRLILPRPVIGISPQPSEPRLPFFTENGSVKRQTLSTSGRDNLILELNVNLALSFELYAFSNWQMTVPLFLCHKCT